MSGVKFALPALASGVLIQMLLAQQAVAATRVVAEDDEREQRTEETRERFLAELETVLAEVEVRNALHPAHQARLAHEVKGLVAEMRAADTEREMWAVAGKMAVVRTRLETARRNQRFHMEEESRFAENQLQRRMRQLESELDEMVGIDVPTDVAALDPAGLEAANRAVRAAREAASVDSEGKSPATELLLTEAAAAIQMLTERVSERRARQVERQAEYELAVTDLHALMAGLKADGLLLRWQPYALMALEERVGQVKANEQALELLQSARAEVPLMIKNAQDAQLKADQRDYILDGISHSLADMGFVVSAPVEEYPDHPATAKVLQAATASGKAVLVSVPVEGEVWYEVEGYQKEINTTPNGEAALACDDGEQVLTEMHARLESDFQVEMSEIWWEGKDPERDLRRAEELPKSRKLVSPYPGSGLEGGDE